MGTHLIALRESFLMNTNMTGFRRFSKNFAFSLHSTKVTSAAEGLKDRISCELTLRAKQCSEVTVKTAGAETLGSKCSS